MKKLIFRSLLVVAVLLQGASGFADTPGKRNPLANYSNTIVLQWNTFSWKVMQGPAYNPLLASRVMAMVHLAMHDALNNISPVYETYALQHEDKRADAVTAVSAAAYGVLVVSFPDKKEQLDAALTEILKTVKDGYAKDHGLTLGEEAARAILNLRKDDGAFADPVGQVNNPEVPGLYQAVPPMAILYAPFWTKMKTFGITSPEQFRVPVMPSLTSTAYTTAFQEVKTKGAKENSARTAEETAIAKFWYEFSEIGWNRVTEISVHHANLDISATARLFALVSMALADSYTAGWDSKFHHNFWRPYTAIRKASTDKNEQTTEDATWEPLMNTPPVHDYPSTHSVLGSAAATVLTGVLGNNVGFTMTSTSAEPANYTRTFKTFTQAAVENGDSRVFAGIHFRFSCERGLEQGKQIGEWILRHQLKKRPVKNL